MTEPHANPTVRARRRPHDPHRSHPQRAEAGAGGFFDFSRQASSLSASCHDGPKAVVTFDAVAPAGAAAGVVAMAVGHPVTPGCVGSGNRHAEPQPHNGAEDAGGNVEAKCLTRGCMEPCPRPWQRQEAEMGPASLTAGRRCKELSEHSTVQCCMLPTRPAPSTCTRVTSSSDDPQHRPA